MIKHERRKETFSSEYIALFIWQVWDKADMCNVTGANFIYFAISVLLIPYLVFFLELLVQMGSPT